MSALLSTKSASFLDLALPGTLVVLDFDGTLARIVGDRRNALPSPRTREALTEVAERFPVAVLSGRAAADVSSRIDGVPVRWVIGNHGAEWPGDAAEVGGWRPVVVGWKRRLARAVARLPGVEVEDKGLSLSIHYRGARRPAATLAEIERVAGSLDWARLTWGKKVLDVTPEDAPDKGSALCRLAVDTGAGRVLFIGDDATDELAFRARLPVPALTVRVGYDETSAAAFHVKRRADVDRVLEALASLRRPGGRRRRIGR